MFTSQHEGCIEGAPASGRPPHLALLRAAPSTDTNCGPDSDGELVAAAARGEAVAWPRLVRRFSGLVCGVARSYGLNDADIADVSQLVWLRLFGHLHRLRDPHRVAGWLATVTRHECIRLLRHRDRTVLTGENDVLDRDYDDDDRVPPVLRESQARLLRSLIGRLPSRQRSLMEMLLCVPRPSYKEISDALGMPVSSIGPTRQRCLAALREKCVSAGLERIPA